MKKFIAAIMMIALVVVMAVSVSAAEAPATDFEYEVVGEAVTIKKYKGTATEVEIPATIESKPVTVIGENAFNDIRTITKVVIPNGVKTIGAKAFYNARGLVEIAIPDSVETIGDDAYYACIAAKKLTIGKGVKTVGERAFSRFSALETLTVAAECTALKADSDCLVDVAKKTVLTGCAKETIIIPEGVEAIGNYAFYGSGNGTSPVLKVVVSSGVKTIGDDVLDATSIEVLVLPKSLTKIGARLAPNTPLRATKVLEGKQVGNIYYEGTAEEWKTIEISSSANAALNNADGNAPHHYNSCLKSTKADWTHSGADAATCTFCSTPAGDQGGTQTPTTPNAPQTGSTVTVLAVVAVVALAATSVVIKRRIED